MADGFRACLDAAQVHECAFGSVADVSRAIKPDLVLMVGSCMQDFIQYDTVRTACDAGGHCLAFWLHDDPYELDFSFRATEVADIIFTSDRWAAQHYEHPRVYHLPLAADPKHDLRPVDERRYMDLFFCGVGFMNRIDFVRDLLPLLKKRHRLNFYGAQWPQDLTFCHNQRLDSKQFADLCSVSRATLNIGRHFDLANQRFSLPASTPGPRTFQAAMAGAVQLFFLESLEIFDYFEPDKEILTFDHPAEVVALLDRLAADPQYVRDVAHAAQRRALSEHTYEHRARQILQRVAEN